MGDPEASPISLTQHTRQGANLDLAMHGDDTAFGATAHDDVASGLTNFLETKALQCPHS